ncbi:type 4a pilus biogenesis protein PilO [Heliorestis acidaminivorans]|uniref:Type 4a pilus biogenesis protein PilO n=1 Tax=Heliorestis acidaminivorans TaxID=553427 RepID=A0A6I0EZW8_9FIRM|nr:type 4a pilus biogenesis protein PilO [Heliorestis acidaminivorans]KAB2951314.1 type 4a pilus biogenesis protein PilO [Heliorestis acidaminivorans]
MNKSLFSNKIVLALIAIVLFLLTAFLFYYQFGQLQVAREAVREEQQQLNQAKVRLQELVAIKANVDIMENNLAYLERRLPFQPRQDDIIKVLHSTAGQSGTHLTNLRFGNEASKDGYVEMPLTLSYEGRYHDVIALLQRFDQAERAFRVEEIKLSKGRGDFPELKADITAKAFYIKE